MSNLELVVEPAWAVSHPEQAKAIYRKHIRRHLGLDKRAADSVRRGKRWPVAEGQGYPPPLSDDGEPLVLASELAPRLGFSRRPISNWIYKGDVKGTTQQEGSYKRMYVSETEVRHYLATRTETRGRPRKGR